MIRISLYLVIRDLPRETGGLIHALQRRYGRSSILVTSDIHVAAAAPVILVVWTLPRIDSDFSVKDITTIQGYGKPDRDSSVPPNSKVLEAAVQNGSLVVPVFIAPSDYPTSAMPPTPPLGLSWQQTFMVHTNALLLADIQRLQHQIDQQLGGLPPIPALVWLTIGAAFWSAVVLIDVFVQGILNYQVILNAVDAPTSVELLWPYWFLCIAAFTCAVVRRQLRWAILWILIFLSTGLLLTALHQMISDGLSGDGSRSPLKFLYFMLALFLAANVLPLMPLLKFGMGSRRIILYRRLTPNEAIDFAALRSQLLYSVFISYRRGDTGNVCDLIYKHLRVRLHGRGIIRGSVFRDTNAILAGSSFPYTIGRALGSARVMLILIGPQWLTITDEKGHKRLRDEDDMVRVEVRLALKMLKLPRRSLIPVLIGGATMPNRTELPSDISQLASFTPFVLRDGRHFYSDIRRLTRAVRKLAEIPTAVPGIHVFGNLTASTATVAFACLIAQLPILLPYIMRGSQCQLQSCPGQSLTIGPGILALVASASLSQTLILVMWTLTTIHAIKVRDSAMLRSLAKPLWLAIPLATLVGCGLSGQTESGYIMCSLLGLICLAVCDVWIILQAFAFGYSFVQYGLAGDSQIKATI